MRVAIVPPTPTPYREPLFERLAARPGIELTVVYQSAREPGWDAPADWFPSEHRYPSRHLRSWQLARPGRTPIVWPRGLQRALRALNPDCVVAFEYGPAALSAFTWCRRRRRRRFVIFTECTPATDRLLPAPQLALHRRLARRADALIAASSSAGERLRSFGVPEERVELGIQSADVAPFRAVADAPRVGPPAVLSVGRLVPDKNLGALIDAFSAARLSDAGATLEIAGTGFLRDELEHHARRLGVPVRFHGHIPPAQLPGLCAAAAVFALVSTYEPFGVVVREAAAAGLPIVCSRAAGAAGDAAREGRNALLVEPSDVGQIAAALRRLVEDEPLRRRMGAESRAVDQSLEGRDVEAFARAIASR